MSEKPEGPKLPVLGGLWGTLDAAAGQAPTLAQARERLGGPWVGGPDVGALVSVRGPRGRRPGVVIHASPAERDVWLGAGRIQRASVADVTAERADDGDPERARIAAEARVFAALGEGQRVAYTDRRGTIGQGTLVEKLRYGALIGLDDGRIVAVSFRRIGPSRAMSGN